MAPAGRHGVFGWAPSHVGRITLPATLAPLGGGQGEGQRRESCSSPVPKRHVRVTRCIGPGLVVKFYPSALNGDALAPTLAYRNIRIPRYHLPTRHIHPNTEQPRIGPAMSVVRLTGTWGQENGCANEYSCQQIFLPSRAKACRRKTAHGTEIGRKM